MKWKDIDMKAAVFVVPGKVKESPDWWRNQAIILVICGSDLWWFREVADRESGSLIVHAAIGVVEEVSNDVKNIKSNDFVIVPFTHRCGHCVACINGFEDNCLNQKPETNGGYQAEHMKYEPANSGLVKIYGKPEDYTDDQLASLQTLSDVMATGYKRWSKTKLHCSSDWGRCSWFCWSNWC